MASTFEFNGRTKLILGWVQAIAIVSGAFFLGGVWHELKQVVIVVDRLVQKDEARAVQYQELRERILKLEIK